MIPGVPVLLGQYRPCDSFLHRLDARAKMVPIMAALVLALFTDSSLFYIITLAMLVGGLLSSGVSVRSLTANMKPLVLLISVTALYHLIFSGGQGEPAFSLFGFDVTVTAVEKAAFFSLRLALFITIAFLLTLTSSPSELAEAFASIIKPLKRLKLPVDDLALILFMAIRFIPVLYEEFVAIRNAQMVRGVNFSGSMINKIRKTSQIFIPVFVAVIGRADDIALAIQARGYGLYDHRTTFSRSKFGLAEIIFILGSCTLLTVAYKLTL